MGNIEIQIMPTASAILGFVMSTWFSLKPTKVSFKMTA
ncbi:hypothetical protein ADIWIN_1127 [Winogradskyella psychrotolerans RS-3]|uniref:Uncharacterized protein n=1 Tax=Winogradskyella psychrotolerans RS-3 TaxID=641526 RepID=S7VX22_9FLAO|nr:hypothetical protein ADIWIN_1127 [Winogradskyella psychrotolerans RS-3]